jgi:PAS domain S-box-containing protein
MNHTDMGVTASWDLWLVVLSYVVAVFASYTALDLAGRVVAARGWGRRIWLAGGAFAMGTGIWAMHFTGMQAYKMSIPVTYDVPVTLLSMAIAIAASALALFAVSRGVMGIRVLLVAGPIMGIGIVSMHYTGMAAMQMPATISYDPFLFMLSVLIAIVASIAALWLAFKFSTGSNAGGRWRWTKGGSALVMGAAIVGMHYTGMAAANFVPTGEVTTRMIPSINNFALGIGIGITTLVILGIALVSSIFDRKFSTQATELEKTEQRYESLFSNNPDAVFSLDPEGNFLSANSACEKISGYSVNELLQMSFWPLIVPEDLERTMQNFSEVTRGEPKDLDIAIEHKDGHRVELSVTALPSSVNGEIVGVYVIAKDSTERKRIEQEIRQLNRELDNRVKKRTKQLETAIADLRENEQRLRDSEERHTLVVEASNDGIYDWGIRTGELYWNDRLFEMFGLSRSEFSPTFEAFLELVHPEDRQKL